MGCKLYLYIFTVTFSLELIKKCSGYQGLIVEHVYYKAISDLKEDFFMKKTKFLSLVPAVLILVLFLFVSCKTEVEEDEGNNGSTQNQTSYYTIEYYSNSSYCKVPVELKNGLKIEANKPLTEEFLPSLSSDYGEFKGWYYSLSSNGTGAKEGDVVSHSLTLYAKWKPNEYEIVYNCNGGTLLGTPVTTYSCNKNTGFYNVKAEHYSYDFDGWYETEDFSTPKVEQLYPFTKTGKLTLYAKWVGVSGANIANKILNMTESGTIYAGGYHSPTNIAISLKTLYERDSSIRVILDLTAVENWEVIPSIYNQTDLDSSITFSELNNLSEIRLPKGVKEIGRYAFRENVNLTRIILPEDLEVLDDLCFYGCKSLKTVTIPNKVTKIPMGAFENSGLKTLVIPSSITYIDQCAFRGCTDLMHVVFTDKESIWYAKDIYHPNMITTIGSMNDPLGNNVKLLKQYSDGYYILYNDKYTGQ